MVLLYGLRIIIVFWMGKCGKLREYYIDDMVLCGLIISIMFGEIKRGENHWEIYGKTMISYTVCWYSKVIVLLTVPELPTTCVGGCSGLGVRDV